MPAIAGFIQVQLFLPSLFIDNVKSDHLYVVWQTNDSDNTRLSNVFFISVFFLFLSENIFVLSKLYLIYYSCKSNNNHILLHTLL